MERTAGQRHGHLWSLALLAGIIGLLTAHTLSREYAELIFGIDAAGETSDVVLTRHDLTLNPWSIRLSQRTRCIIRENVGWAFAYNLIAVPLAASGIISPVIAAAAMAISSLLVVGNSRRSRAESLGFHASRKDTLWSMKGGL